MFYKATNNFNKQLTICHSVGKLDYDVLTRISSSIRKDFKDVLSWLKAVYLDRCLKKRLSHRGSKSKINFSSPLIAQSDGAVEYTNCLPAEGEKAPPRNECPGYDTKLSDGEVPVMLELWGMQSTPSLPSLPGPLWPGVVLTDRVLSMDQIQLNCVLMLNCLK